MPALNNAKHEQFAHAVANGANATEAYIAVGYSEQGAHASASRLLKTAKVAARVAEICGNIAKVAEEKSGISKAWVIERLVDNVNRAMQTEAVRDKEGNPTGEYTYQGSVANKALELIGKELGMFVEKKEITNTHQGTISLKLAAARQRLAQLSE